MDRRRPCGTAARALSVLVGCAILVACARAVPDYLGVPGVQEIDLKWQPRTGLRIVHQVRTSVKMSGEAVKSIPKEEREQRMSVTRTAEVIDVKPEFFTVRFGQDGIALPATVRFSRGWVPVEVVLDDPAALSDRDKIRVNAALGRFEDAFRQAAQFFRLWKVGDKHPFEFRLAGVPQAAVTGTGSMSLRRAVMIGDRTAGEFDWDGTAEFSFSGTTGLMTVSGREWRDVATGVSIRLISEAHADFAIRGRTARLEYEGDEALDFASSRL